MGIWLYHGICVLNDITLSFFLLVLRLVVLQVAARHHQLIESIFCLFVFSLCDWWQPPFRPPPMRSCCMTQLPLSHPGSDTSFLWDSGLILLELMTASTLDFMWMVNYSDTVRPLLQSNTVLVNRILSEDIWFRCELSFFCYCFLFCFVLFFFKHNVFLEKKMQQGLSNQLKLMQEQSIKMVAILYDEKFVIVCVVSFGSGCLLFVGCLVVWFDMKYG